MNAFISKMISSEQFDIKEAGEALFIFSLANNFKMKKLLLFLLFVVVVHARWSLNYAAKHHDDDGDHDHDELDWWEHGVFYQVTNWWL